MSTIWIVSDKNPPGYPLDRLLSKRSDCEVHRSADIRSGGTAGNVIAPDIVVVDFASLPRSSDSVLERFASLSPFTPVIAVYPDQSVPSLRMPERFATDEVFVSKEGEHQRGQVAESLLTKIDVLDRILRVQQRLQQEMNERRIIAKSKVMRDILQKLPSLAASLSTVLITGETGTGKELIARAIHYLGPRAGKPFITVDCGSIPDTLIENELFGHVRGAYTDASSAARGLLQEADGGTVFLDEIEALPLSVQSKFLRFLQERQIRPLGQTKYSAIDVRIVSSTNGNLRSFIETRQFREDLYYRLNVIPLYLPPLRDRKSDIPDLVRYFMNRHTHDESHEPLVPDQVVGQWLDYDWPGNIRELENKVQEWLTTREHPWGGVTVRENVAEPLPSLLQVRKQSLDQIELAYFCRLLTASRGNISAAARVAQIDRKSLRRLLRKHGIDATEFRN